MIQDGGAEKKALYAPVAPVYWADWSAPSSCSSAPPSSAEEEEDTELLRWVFAVFNTDSCLI